MGWRGGGGGEGHSRPTLHIHVSRDFTTFNPLFSGIRTTVRSRWSVSQSINTDRLVCTVPAMEQGLRETVESKSVLGAGASLPGVCGHQDIA